MSTKEGFTLYRRKTGPDAGRLCISFRVASGEWKDRRVPKDHASTERQAEKWARAFVGQLRAAARSGIVGVIHDVRPMRRGRTTVHAQQCTVSNGDGPPVPHVLLTLGRDGVEVILRPAAAEELAQRLTAAVTHAQGIAVPPGFEAVFDGMQEFFGDLLKKSERSKELRAGFAEILDGE
jgi:hypothetical protein